MLEASRRRAGGTTKTRTPREKMEVERVRIHKQVNNRERAIKMKGKMKGLIGEVSTKSTGFA